MSRLLKYKCAAVQNLMKYTGSRIHGSRFWPPKINHILGKTIYQGCK